MLYTAEFLPNLGRLVAAIELPCEGAKVSGISFSDNILVVDFRASEPVPLVNIKLPLKSLNIGEPVLQALTYSNTEANCIFGIGAAHDSPLPHLTTLANMTTVWSVDDLSKKSPKNNDNINEFVFVCKNCDTSIIDSKDKKFIDMPLEYWHEMMDFWHCHKPHEDHHDMHDKSYDGKLVPKTGQVYIGAHYILLPPGSDKCPGCERTLGTIEGQALKIHKWNLNLRYAENVETYEPFVYAYSAALDRMNGSGIRRFSVRCKTAINVWVLNAGIGFTSQNGVLLDCLKVLYHELLQPLEDDVMDVPLEVYDSLSKVLHLLLSGIPEAARTRQATVGDAVRDCYLGYLGSS